MIRSTVRRATFALACAGAFPLFIVGCKKETPPPPVVTTPPPAEISTAPLELVPLIEDAGVDADADAAPVKKAGSGLTANQSRAKQCCNSLRAQAKQLGPSPEGAQLVTVAGMCDAVAGQLGPNAANAPEFAPIRAMLKGKTLPAVCQGL